MKRCPNCTVEYEDSFKVCPRDGGLLEDLTVVLPAPPAPVLPANADPMIGATIANRFRIVGKLGEGGMGAVYKAEHTKMDRLCAIKILGAHMTNDPDALARFTREAQMSSRIDHPHAVTIYDYGESENGLVYLAMEYIDGETLSSLLRRTGPLGLERTAGIARQIGDALDAAHALGIVHRDLKPDNIMIGRKATTTDFVKVLDFGIAKMAESEDKRHDLTQAGLVIGTPFYMSPEQVSGHKLDPRSDVYSFALIVYEMLSGRMPFEGENGQAVMIARLTSPPKPLRQANPHVSEGVEAAVMRALVRDRDARIPSAGQFVGEFEDARLGRDRAATKHQESPDTVAIQAQESAYTGGAPPAATPPVGSTSDALDPYATNRAAQSGGAGGAAVESFPTDRVAPSSGYGVAPQQAGLPQSAYAGQYSGNVPAAKKGGRGALIALAAVVGLVVLLVVGSAVTYFVFFRAKPAQGGAVPTGPTAGGTPTTGSGAPEAQDAAYQDYQEGIKLQQAENFPGAVAKYRAAIAKRHVFPKAHGNLGAALFQMGNYREAISSLNVAIDQDPTNGQFYQNAGLASFKLEDYRKAAEAFKKAASLDNDPLNYAYWGFALDNAGDRTGAWEQYKKYLSSAPSGDYADPIREILVGTRKAPTGPEA